MVPKHNYLRSRRVATGMLSKWGTLGALRRVGSADRQTMVVVTDYGPIERLGRMIDPIDRVALVSALAPDGSVVDPPPDRELDVLVTYVPGTEDDPQDDEVLRFTTPPGKLNPGPLVVYWELKVRR